MAEHKCRDCRAEIAAWKAWLEAETTLADAEPRHPLRVRKAPNPGPRCHSHWKARQREVKAANHEKRVQRVFGLEPGEYARLYAFQGGRCSLCRRATGASKKLAVDHDHATGLVRSLLCGVCNKWILGHARDRIDFFERCIEYLRYPPYSRMKDGVDFHE